MTRDELITRLLDAQAELQTGLGFHRLGLSETEPELVEGYMVRSLRMQQHILAKLGTQMAGGPAADDPDTERQA